MARWIVVLTTGLVIIGLGVVFLLIGLSQADQLASTVGALAGVAGLGLSVWAVVPTRARSTGQSAALSVDTSGSTTSAGPTPDGQISSAAASSGPASSATASGDAGSAGRTKYRVDARHGRSIQIGDNNTQNNTYY